MDADALEAVIELEKPDYVVPEIEAIATSKLVELEAKGLNVVPTANATKLTMNREGIRRPQRRRVETEHLLTALQTPLKLFRSRC